MNITIEDNNCVCPLESEGGWCEADEEVLCGWAYSDKTGSLDDLFKIPIDCPLRKENIIISLKQEAIKE